MFCEDELLATTAVTKLVDWPSTRIARVSPEVAYCMVVVALEALEVIVGLVREKELSPIKKAAWEVFTTFELVELLLRARAYTVPLPREIVKVLPLCQLSGVLSPTSQAYSKVPPFPVLDKLTVAVVFSWAVLPPVIITLEAVGAVTVVPPSSQIISLSVPLDEPKGVEDILYHFH